MHLYENDKNLKCLFFFIFIFFENDKTVTAKRSHLKVTPNVNHSKHCRRQARRGGGALSRLPTKSKRSVSDFWTTNVPFGGTQRYGVLNFTRQKATTVWWPNTDSAKLHSIIFTISSSTDRCPLVPTLVPANFFYHLLSNMHKSSSDHVSQCPLHFSIFCWYVNKTCDV